ncbi:hypothetical protein [Chryseobacterium sp. Bi04]|uniref:hypothetical protein n=1 Tax=Chryseobacterium sp. Bi04 TaxID=2822345 RepID=UPI001E2E9E70|nr:hypothetical protein [Chryseobacterium sp. Bi04]
MTVNMNQVQKFRDQIMFLSLKFRIEIKKQGSYHTFYAVLEALAYYSLLNINSGKNKNGSKAAAVLLIHLY